MKYSFWYLNHVCIVVVHLNLFGNALILNRMIETILATDLRNFGAIEHDYLRQLEVLIAKDVSICEPYSHVHDECMLMLLYNYIVVDNC